MRKFCHCCGLESDDVVQYRTNDPCTRCKRRRTTKCLHSKVCDAETVAELIAEAKTMLEEHPDLLGVDGSVMGLFTGAADATSNKHSIHYDPGSNIQGFQEHSKLVDQELELRGLEEARLLSYKDQVAILYQRLVLEDRFRYLRAAGDALTPEDAMMIIEEAVPCILHLENRCSEKLFSLILQKMIDNCKDDKAIGEKTKEIEKVLNKQVWGTESRPSQYQLKLEKKAGEGLSLGDINLPNTRARKLIENIDPILDVALSHDENLRSKTKEACGLYVRFTSIARQREDFTDEEIENFQDLVDDFTVIMVDLYQKPFMTNYFHMLASGHIKYYMEKWRNLYRYEQQGWEAMNAMIKYFCKCQTFRGNLRGKKGGKQTTLLLLTKCSFLTQHPNPIFDWRCQLQSQKTTIAHSEGGTSFLPEKEFPRQVGWSQ